MARPPKPTAVKKLQDTLRKCRTKKDEPLPKVSLRDVDPPAHLTKGAQDVWKFALSQVPDGLLTGLDFAIFEQWCILYDLLMRTVDRINDEGLFLTDDKGNAVLNPAVNGQLKMQAQIRALQNDLGFTPASRTRISTTAPDKPKNEFVDL